MANPTVTGADKSTTGASTISIDAPTGMQDGDRIIFVWRTTANVTDPASPEGWDVYPGTNNRVGVVISPPLTVADGPWDVLSHSGAPGTRHHWYSYTPGDDDVDPVIGTWGTSAGVMPGIVIDEDGSIVIGVGSTNSSNSSWTKPPELTNDNGLVQSGFSNILGTAYEEGVAAQTLGDLSYTFASTSSPNYGVLIVVPGPAPADPPVLVSATIDGDELVLTYDEALDETSVPAVGDFVVEVDEVAQSDPTAVDVDGTTVLITTDEPVAAGAVVTLSYTPGANPIQADDDGSEAAALTDEPVTNNTVAPMPYAIRARIERGRRQ